MSQKRVTKEEAQKIRNGLRIHLRFDAYMHPEQLPNEYEGIWISDVQKRAFLRRMAEAKEIDVKYHGRGWYTYAVYKRTLLDEIPF